MWKRKEKCKNNYSKKNKTKQYIHTNKIRNTGELFTAIIHKDNAEIRTKNFNSFFKIVRLLNLNYDEVKNSISLNLYKLFQTVIEIFDR